MKNGILLVLLASVMMFSCDSATDFSPELIQDEAVIQDQFPTQIELTESELTDEERMILNEVGFFAKHGVRGVTFSRSKVFTFENPGGPAVGRSILARYDGGIYALLLSALPIGDAVTMWLVIFNAPENCSDNVCGEDDLNNDAAQVDITYAGGHVVLPVLSRRFWGDSWFFTQRHEGDISGSIVPVVFGKEALGLVNARKAEVHLIARTHGRAIAGMEEAMTSTFGGGCEGGLPPELGPPGPNTCEDIQFAVHKSDFDVDRTELLEFQPAGDFGGGVLEAGTFFPPTEGGESTLSRGDNWISYTLQTTGLPAGAYTNWWVILNHPDECANPDPTVGSQCGLGDAFLPDPSPSVFWATGGVVQDDGVGHFQARIFVGDDLGIPGEQFLFGPGLLNPKGAEVFLIVKYHGPASDDPDVLRGQTYTLLGSCSEGANADASSMQCFDPQFAFHVP